MTLTKIVSLIMSAFLIALVFCDQPALAKPAADPGQLFVTLDTTLPTSQLTNALQVALDNAALQRKKLVLANREQVIPISRTIYLASNANVDFNNCTVKRDPSYGIFDLMRNRGNNNISLSNLKLDGSKNLDGRSSLRKDDRFSGLELIQVIKVRLKNIEVSYTVNAEIQSEGTKAGIYLNECSDVLAQGLDGHHNDKSAILISNSQVVIDGSLTHHNAGSGITSYNADNSEYHNIVTHDNGYSQLSVNGRNSIISGVYAYNGNKGYANLNIGHNSVDNDSSNTVARNVRITGGHGWGITVNGSTDVTLSEVSVSGNNGFNIYVMDNTHRLKLDKVSCFSSRATGIYYKSGSGHTIERSSIYNNGIYGIEIGKKSEVSLGPEVYIYDNINTVSKNLADLVVTGTARVSGMLLDSSRAKSSKSNIWIAGGKLYINRSLTQADHLGTSLNIIKTSGGELME